MRPFDQKHENLRARWGDNPRATILATWKELKAVDASALTGVLRTTHALQVESCRKAAKAFKVVLP